MFVFNYRIQKDDINYGGHVGNERALLFFKWLECVSSSF